MKKFVGITKCPVGIAHTYMAAEKLQKAGEAQGYEVKIETQGASGVEDELSAQDVADADFVIIAADVAVDGEERFNGKQVLYAKTADAIKDANALIERL
ncbi:PTS fructose transporter subunit IIB [Latilactobacillus fuchuensis]|uniref:PTS fructose transporter subunit IIB n=1 Tax=Latilactobacillus fuchuensis TaxID=164393 RepID=UPI0005573D45|nr:PTS fructose transporter subunit IIB [Latilactobacillus fuchuensis]